MINSLRFYFSLTQKESLQIIKRYKQLPYVIIYHKYLIPNRPPQPISRYQLLKKKLLLTETPTQNLHLKELKSKYFELPDIQKQNLNKQHAIIIENYKRQLINHMLKYLSPLLVKNINGFAVFQLAERKKSKLTQQNITQINEKWKKLTQQQKHLFSEKAKLIKALKAKQYQQYVSKHQIPFFNTSKLQIKDIKQSQSIHLPQTEQEKIVYQKFLKTWNLTQPQMNNIIITCIRYYQYKKALAQQKKVQKPNQKIQNEVQQDQQKLDNSPKDQRKP